MKMGATFLVCVLALAFGSVGAGVVLWADSVLPLVVSETEAVLMTGFAAATVGFLAVLIAIWGVISSRAIARRQTTFAHITMVETDGSTQEAQQEFNRLARAGNLEQYAAADKVGSPETQAILNILNGFEIISIGIQRGIIEPEFYKLWYKSQTLRTWRDAQPFIVALRLRVNSTSIFHEFEELARWMNEDRIPHRRFWWTGIL